MPPAPPAASVLPDAARRRSGRRLRRVLANPVAWRLGSGLVLFAFVLLHLANHALGLVSLEVMQQAQDLRLALTRNRLGTLVLIAAALVHLALGLARLVQADSLRIGARSLLQLLFGLLIPILLIRHVLGTRGVAQMFGIDDSYVYALWAMWPGEAASQALLIALVWGHGCIGLHNWLGGRTWYRRSLWLWQGIAVLVPALAYAGFVSAARLAQVLGGYDNPFQPGQYDRLVQITQTTNRTYLALLALALLVWGAMILANRLGSRIRITYVNGPTVQAPRGLSLLAISRLHRVPHASVCGGRARCSTCRVRILAGQDTLAPPSDREAQVLARIRAPAQVRLACQIQPKGPLTVAMLMPAEVDPDSDLPVDKYLWGVEREVTVMFCDLRGFTRMSEGRLPYDVVFLMNRFLGRMSEAIEDAGGHVDKFIGDGIMAIFGMDGRPEDGARAAMRAADAMGGVLATLNHELREVLPAPLSMGIGLHSGPAILGRVGGVRRHQTEVPQVTALGETVNLASRLESAARDRGVELVVSADCVARSGVRPGPGWQAQSIPVRGLSGPVAVYLLPRASDLIRA